MDSRPQSLTDESVARFLSRRFGQTAADTLASALLHGIYAGDSTKLSARSLFPLLWNLETKIGSVCVGAIINRLCDPKTTAGEINETVSRLGFQDPSPRVPNYLNTSIWTTRTGLSEVVYAIVSHLENCAQVEIKKSINVKRIRQSESNGLEVGIISRSND
jgi:protoporphyrinogen/coproporphyrinogen III oxidase